MIFSATWFSYGAGLVMVGWFAGMAVSMAFSAFRSVH